MGPLLGAGAPPLRRSLGLGPCLRVLTRWYAHSLRLLRRDASRMGPLLGPRAPPLRRSLGLDLGPREPTRRAEASAASRVARTGSGPARTHPTAGASSPPLATEPFANGTAPRASTRRH